MKRALLASGLVGMCALAAAFGLLFAGCEDGSGTVALLLTPSSTTLSGRTNTVTFTVGGGTNSTADSGLRALSLPLEWWVDNPALGRIIAAGGTQATYTRTSQGGINVVRVRDQYDAEGYATVHQR